MTSWPTSAASMVATSITSRQRRGPARSGGSALGRGPPVKLLDGVLFGNFDLVERGIYYLDGVSGEASRFFSDWPPDETRLRYFDFATQAWRGELRPERVARRPDCVLLAYRPVSRRVDGCR
jgi:hypothetical protein